MSSNVHPVIANQVLESTTSAEYELKPSSDQQNLEEMIEKLEADAIALLHRLETASADIELSTE
ncbi:MAG: hypothetical protein ACSHXI_21805 [Hoeflea sp.]|uniref:hypothetical protein n=1 Tax=Hoeflea sp. TaxID=1940281 RepID=UPI003EFA4155